MPAIISYSASAADAVRETRCRLCRRRPGKPCTRRGDHLGRWVSALKAGAITEADVQTALDGLVIISWRAIVPECSWDEPGECWATRDGQREVHDLRKCEHFLPCAGGAA
jgi:hypothetical protein